MKFEELFKGFLLEYLNNVIKELPESYRAQQMKNGGVEAGLVMEFETRFLKEPFRKALQDYEERVRKTIRKYFPKNRCMGAEEVIKELEL